MVLPQTQIEKPDFDQIVKDRCEAIVNVLSVKGKEYRRNGNVFHNFEQGARITGETREKVLFGFMLKHLISVMDIIDDLEKGIVADPKVVDEKIGDIQVYLVLLEGMLKIRK